MRNADTLMLLNVVVYFSTFWLDYELRYWLSTTDVYDVDGVSHDEILEMVFFFHRDSVLFLCT